MDDKILEFDMPKEASTIIKVIGVGGGGGNAVAHMYKKGIHDVSFVLCNTDQQALKQTDVPNQIILGREITSGLGAGNNPEVAERAASASEDEIRNMLDDGTKMVFITAGMGGGTGTGAAPVIARIAKNMGILTVGIVTVPFLFEGKPKIIQAVKGVMRISANVDALLVINNERLREIYSDLSVVNAFGKADDTLTIAAKSIAEIITLPGLINLDFADVNTTMKESGVALMSNGYGEGEGRVRKAVEDALHSPLLSNNDVKHARKILFNVYFSEQSELQMEEMNDIHNFMAEFNQDIHVIWGTAIDNTLGDKVKITIIATGFTMNEAVLNGIYNTETEKIVSEKDAKDQADREKEEGKIEKVIQKIYGRDKMVTMGQQVHHYTTVVLADDELDDDTFIALLEENPTYKRNTNLVEKARKKLAEVVEAPVESEKKETEAPKNNRIINFNND